MKSSKFWPIWLLCTIAMLPVWAQKPMFNADSAFAHVKHLSVTIGPRPMGSANEQEALRWAAEKFKSYGADTAYVMPYFEAPRGVNTTSGVAVALFPGQSDSIIVIGGHIDSDSRINPGASDNASGTACVIELARMWAKAPPQRYTLLFAAFGGEERGLIGSKFFAENYPRMDLVRLMFSIDMAGTPGWLIPFIDTESHQAPRWLVEDAYAVDRALGYNSLEYPTHFFSINNALGGAGSDHMPFMEKNIPAIDFTAGINIDPIHTPQDHIGFVDKNMLARSGRIVNALLEKYQENGIPSAHAGHYMMWETFLGRQFIPKWMIFIVVIVGLIAGVGGILQARKFGDSSLSRGLFSGTKLFLLMIVIAAFTQFGEGLLQIIKGTRYPWMTHFREYMIYAAIWTLGGFWVAAQTTRRWRFSENAFGYAIRAAVLLILLTGLLLMKDARLALYPAVSLLLLYLVINLRPAALQLLAALAVPLPMFRLMFMETLPFLARSLTVAGFQITTFKHALLFSSILTAVLTIWFLPTLFTWAFITRYIASVQQFVEQFRRSIVGLIILFAILGYGGYLVGLSAFSDRWQPLVRVQATYDMNTNESGITVNSNDFLRNVNVQGVQLNRQIDGETLSEKLDVAFLADWLKVNRMDSLAIGEMDTIFIDWAFGTTHPWYRAELTVTCDSGAIQPLIETVNYAKLSDTKLQFRWEAEPAERVRVTGRLIIPAGRKLIREWKGVYPFLPMPLNVTSQSGAVMYQTDVTFRDTLSTADPAGFHSGMPKMFTADSTDTTLIDSVIDSVMQTEPDSLQNPVPE